MLPRKFSDQREPLRMLNLKKQVSFMAKLQRSMVSKKAKRMEL